MSRSLTELFGNLASPMGVQQPTTPNTIYNPEIPDSNLAVRKAIRDNYYSSMKLPTNSVRNGDGYSFSMRGGSQRYFNPRDDAFGLDGGIDPLNIRRRTDPNGIPPRNFATGALYVAFDEWSSHPVVQTTLRSCGFKFYAHKEATNELVYYKWCRGGVDKVPKPATSIEGACCVCSLSNL